METYLHQPSDIEEFLEQHLKDLPSNAKLIIVYSGDHFKIAEEIAKLNLKERVILVDHEKYNKMKDIDFRGVPDFKENIMMIEPKFEYEGARLLKEFDDFARDQKRQNQLRARNYQKNLFRRK